MNAGPGAPRMYCVPYAAGSFRVYADWQQSLPGIEVVPLEAPGRGKRFGEPLLNRVGPLVADLRSAIETDRPFVLFGHSLGALLAFELARALRAEGSEPAALLVSGMRAPDTPALTEPASQLSDVDFRARLVELNGTPKELLDSDELMELMIPVLRADFAAADHYVYRTGPPLDCRLVAFGSLRDPEVDIHGLRGWSRQTAAEFTAHAMPGDHFFVLSHRDELLGRVRAELAKLDLGLTTTGRATRSEA